MAINFSLPLQASEEQHGRLTQLQATFAQACNSLAPLVRETRCWNRVGLHHMAYRNIRERFPQLGSQMACNAIYSVSRACRLVYQNPQSPWCVTRTPSGKLPLVLFEKSAPVYFDRHTLSLRNGAVSMFTLDGRMRFDANLSATQSDHFSKDRLREVVLQRIGASFELCFYFSAKNADEQHSARTSQFPEYLIVMPWEANGMTGVDEPVRHLLNEPLTGVA